MLHLYIHEGIVAGLEERISSWPRLKRIVALVLCFKKKVLDCISRTSLLRNWITQGSIACHWTWKE